MSTTRAKRDVLLTAVVWYMETESIPDHLGPQLSEHGITIDQVKEAVDVYLQPHKPGQ